MSTLGRIVRRAVGPLVAAGVISGLVWVVGFDWATSATLAASILGIFTLRHVLGSGTNVGWRERPEGDDLTGARREVARLSWSMHGLDARVDRRSVERLRAVAAARLAEQGLDLMTEDDDAGCRRILGDQALATLTAHPNHPPRFDAYVAAVDVVERLTPKEHPR
jgi:hypothetical protein